MGTWHSSSRACSQSSKENENAMLGREGVAAVHADKKGAPTGIRTQTLWLTSPGSLALDYMEGVNW